jgi:hypothetical protein
MSDQTLEAMSTSEKVSTLLNAAALVMAFAKLQDKGELEACRLGLRQLWKGFSNDTTPQSLRNQTEIVLDCFFDFEGDMHAAAESIQKAVNDICPDGLHSTVASKLELKAVNNATAILEAKPVVKARMAEVRKQ